MGRQKSARDQQFRAKFDVVNVRFAASEGIFFGAKEELNWKGRLRKRIEKAIGIKDGLNWKGALAEKLKNIASSQVYPDHRVEWVPYAVDKLDELLASSRPDAVIVSHEPACTLPVGLAAAQRGLKLVVDMGDPVLAPYTPRKWMEKAFELERAVCQAASFVSVTTEAAADLLMSRHALDSDKLLVLKQGYDPGFIAEQQDALIKFDSNRVELLYTGSFYSFRRADYLIRAICSVREVRLTVATISAPDYLLEAADRFPESIRIVGFLPHRAALAAQRSCDVLVNLANSDPVQIPGKIFEYLGAEKPILHLRGDRIDATGKILREVGGGWELAADGDGLNSLLEEIKCLKASGDIHRYVAPHHLVGEFAWPTLSEKWAAKLQHSLVSSGGSRG